jgi:hypothetical protein
MSESVPAPAPALARGLFQDLVDLYVAPREAFASLVVKRSFWLALAILLAVNAAGAAIWLQKVDKKEFIRSQIEEYGMWDKIPAEQREAALDTSGFDRQVWLGIFVFRPLFFAALAGIYLFIYRFFFASEVSFVQSLTILLYTFMAVELLKGPLVLLILAMKGDWNLNPEFVLQASPALFLDKQSVPKAVWALVDSIDLFSFWTLWLITAGHRAASRLTASSAFVGAAIPWVIYVLIKVGFSALF